MTVDVAPSPAGTSVGSVTTQISAINLTRQGEPASMSSSPPFPSSPSSSEGCQAGETQLSGWATADCFLINRCSSVFLLIFTEYLTSYWLSVARSVLCRSMELRRSCLMSWKMPVAMTVSSTWSYLSCLQSAGSLLSWCCKRLILIVFCCFQMIQTVRPSMVPHPQHPSHCCVGKIHAITTENVNTDRCKLCMGLLFFVRAVPMTVCLEHFWTVSSGHSERLFPPHSLLLYVLSHFFLFCTQWSIFTVSSRSDHTNLLLSIWIYERYLQVSFNPPATAKWKTGGHIKYN